MNCKDCAHAGKCETLFDNTEVCEDYRASCPLPRIGSKEWGWHRGLGGWCIVSDACNYVVFWYPNGYSEVRSVSGKRVVGQIEDNETAKRIAELLARRDWRRENRGKK